MAKNIKFKYKGKTYTLEYTRSVVAEMEDAGFNPEEMEEKPFKSITMLFAGAFKAHHPDVDSEIVEEITKSMVDKKGLIGKLVEMYSEPVLSLIEEPAEEEGNISWTASW